MYAERRSRLPISWFLLVAAAIVATDVWATRSSRFGDAPTVGAVAVMLDLTVVVPLAYWFLIVRNRLARPGSVIAVAAVGTLLASTVIPSDATAFVHGTRWLLVAAELGLVGYATSRAVGALRQARTAGDQDRDFFDHLQEQLRRVVSARAVADAISSEAALLYYALFSWGAQPHVPSSAQSFTCHKATGLGGLVAVVVGLSTFEIPLVHILLQRWQPWIAWAATAAGIYGIVWGIGVFQSVRLRPTLLTGDALWVRVGLLSSIRIPLGAIDRIEPARFPHPDKNASGYLRALVIGDPQRIVHLKEPLVAERLYGLRRSVTYIGLALDDIKSFDASIRAHLGSGGDEGAGGTSRT